MGRWGLLCLALLACPVVAAAVALGAGALSADPSALPFADQHVTGGTPETKTATITNDSAGPVVVSGSSITAGSADFAIDTDGCASGTLLQGQTCDVSVTFDPQTQGVRNGTLEVASDDGPLTVLLSGKGTALALTPDATELVFDPQDVDETSPQTLATTIENTGTETLHLKTSTFDGTDSADFAVATPALPGDCNATTSLTAGQDCVVRVTFDPDAVGDKSGTLHITSDQLPDVTVSLTGKGIQTELQNSPSTLALGSRDIDEGPTATQESTVTNTGTQSVSISAVTIGGGDPAHFSRLTGEGTDCSSSTTLTAGQTCKLRVRFDPSSVGTKSALLSVDSSAGSQSTALEGTGIQTALSSNVASISAGSQDVDDGPTTTQQATLTNTGTEPVTLSGVSLGGANAGEFERLTGDGADCNNGRSLTAGQTCKVRTRFDPSSTGAKSARVTASSNVPDITIDLSGTGIQTSLSRDPSALDFGPRPVGSGATAIQESTITNNGTQPVTLNTIRLLDPGAARFLLVTATPTDCAAGGTLAVGETCKLRAMLVAQSVGAKTGTVAFSSTAGDATVVLTGIGTRRVRLAIPRISGRASSTKNKRLKVPVTPSGGTIRNIVVDIRSRAGKLLGTAKLSSAARKRTVTVHLKKRLAPGRYVARGRGRDAFGNRINASARNFTLR